MEGYGWPRGTTLTYWIDAVTGCPPGLDPAQAEAQIAAAPLAWEAVCGIRFQRVSDRAQANIVTTWDATVALVDDDYDLARTDLPVAGGPAQLRNRLNPEPRAGWTLPRLYLAEIHEFGHAIGQVHSPAGLRSIMSAYLDESLSGPTVFDENNARADYGPPVPAAPSTITLRLPDGGTLVYTTPAVPTVAAGPFDPVTVPLPDGSQLTLTYVPPTGDAS